MKAKLLRKLRKRFYWWQEPMTNCWYYYDRKANSKHYCFLEGYHYVNDMLQITLLRLIGCGHLFVKLRDRVERRRKIRHNNALREKFKPYFK